MNVSPHPTMKLFPKPSPSLQFGAVSWESDKVIHFFSRLSSNDPIHPTIAHSLSPEEKEKQGLYGTLIPFIYDQSVKELEKSCKTDLHLTIDNDSLQLQLKGHTPEAESDCADMRTNIPLSDVCLAQLKAKTGELLQQLKHKIDDQFSFLA